MKNNLKLRSLIVIMILALLLCACGDDKSERKARKSNKNKDTEQVTPTEAEDDKKSDKEDKEDKKDDEEPEDEQKKITLPVEDEEPEITVPADAPEKMSHNIYMDPDLSEGSGEYRAFLIDFMGEDIPVNTYWALCNWSMKNGFYAYAGLQHTAEGQKAILSFWEGEVDGKMITASRVYPSGNESEFGGEGEGTHWITDYDWKAEQWYRMLLYCWDDAETGHTFVGQWVCDLESGKWTLISYFDTQLVDSAMTGNLSQFQENYWANKDYLRRRYRVKNIYTFDRIKADWLSLNKTRFSYDYPEWGYNTAGTHKFGSEPEYFWGEAGEYVPNQEEYDANEPKELLTAINQAVKPEKISSLVENLNASEAGGKINVTWNLSDTSAPVIKYTLRLMDKDGKQVEEMIITRPELVSATLTSAYKAGNHVQMETCDIFGEVGTYDVVLK